VLEDKCFERVGGNRTIQVDVRLIAATNRNLPEQIAAGRFREDLFYRINVLEVHLPPLKERSRCLVPLARKLLHKASASMRKRIDDFSPEALAMIQGYNWPGNIRQLANTIERAVILEDSPVITPTSLQIPELSRVTAPLIQTAEPLETHERELILKALEENLWVQKNAARCLGISPRVLNYKINKFNITHPNWRKNKR
jgi:DNA-binding NtrC family response regulator